MVKTMNMSKKANKETNIPLPHTEELRNIHAEVNLQAFEDAMEASKRINKGKKMKIKEILEWGLRAFKAQAEGKR